MQTIVKPVSFRSIWTRNPVCSLVNRKTQDLSHYNDGGEHHKHLKLPSFKYKWMWWAVETDVNNKNLYCLVIISSMCQHTISFTLHKPIRIHGCRYIPLIKNANLFPSHVFISLPPKSHPFYPRHNVILLTRAKSQREAVHHVDFKHTAFMNDWFAALLMSAPFSRHLLKF